MQLDEFLNGLSILNLQSLQWQWSPTTRRSSSKRDLLRILRREMLSADRARERFAALDESQQDFLRGLLRLDRYEGDVDFLTLRLAEGRPSSQAVRELLDDLAHRGFLQYRTVGTSGRGDTYCAVMSHELGDVLAEALNLDTREPELMLSLARYLGELSPRERRDRFGDEQAPTIALLAELTEPEAIEHRIAGLEDARLRQAARIALGGCGGVLPLERFPSLGLDLEDVDGAAWRAALEAACLGTFGHLCLLASGLGDDHECLVLHHEVVRAWAAAQAADPAALDHVYACGIDFLTDLSATVDFVRAQPSRLTSAGRFFKGARNELRPHTALLSTFFMDEESLLSFRLAVARELGLVELRDDGRLHATPASVAWETLPLAGQARDVLGVMLRLGATAAPRHFRSLADMAQQALLDLEPGRWQPTAAFTGGVLARYAARLLDDGPPTDGAAADVDSHVWRYLHPPATLGATAEAAREPLLRALNYAGLLDIGRSGDHAYVRRAALADVVLGGGAAAEPGRLVIVNPDFEVVLFPEPGHVTLLHRLCAFCDREKNEVTLHLRLTRQSVQRAVLRGLDAEGIVATLRDHCRVPLAQNIDYSIRTWADGIHPAAIQTLHVLELPSPQLLDAALALPAIAPLVARRLSPTAVALTLAHLSPEAEDELKQLGIHLM